MFGECHAHIFMNGYDYRQAVMEHQGHPDERRIREHLKAYQTAGVTYVRDGGDRFGSSLLARKLAPEYGITYRTPGFAIHKAGHYGVVVGRAFHDYEEYKQLLKELKAAGSDFVKIMTTGIMDFNSNGRITGAPLGREEVIRMVGLAHDMGFSVMSHTNTASAVMDAVEAGADSIEHGNFQNEESICCMAEHDVVWVPTVVTVKNLIGAGRFSDVVLSKIWQEQQEALKLAYKNKALMALGSDAGAYRVFHGQGIVDEYRAFRQIFGDSEELSERLMEGERKIRMRF